MKNRVTIEFVNQLFYEKNVLKKTSEELERELDERIEKYLLNNPDYEYEPIIFDSEKYKAGDIIEVSDEGIECKYTGRKWLPLYKSKEEREIFIREKLKEREKISNSSKDSFKKYELEFMNMDDDAENTYFEIISPEEVKGIAFSLNQDDNLLPHIENEVNDPFKYIKTDNFNPFDDNMKNNLIVMVAHINFLNEKFKKEEKKYKEIYEGIKNKVKKWFLEIEDFGKNFEEEVNKLNNFGEIINKKDLKTSHELIAKYNFMNDVSIFYRKLTDKMFIQKTEEGNINTYLDLLDKTLYIVNSDEGKFKLKPIVIDDRMAQFEIVSPVKYKGNYVILNHIPVFVLGLTAVRPYFTNGILTRYGKSELEFVIKQKKFYKKLIYKDLQKFRTGYKNSEYLKFRNFYKKIFESDNNFKVDNPDETEKNYFYVINQFYEKYADIVSRRYKNTLEIMLVKLPVYSFNVPDKRVYSISELSGKSPESIYDLFMTFFINRLVKKHTPLNNLPVPKGSFIMGNANISIHG